MGRLKCLLSNALPIIRMAIGAVVKPVKENFAGITSVLCALSELSQPRPLSKERDYSRSEILDLVN
jgi:hypothetical protein